MLLTLTASLLVVAAGATVTPWTTVFPLQVVGQGQEREVLVTDLVVEPDSGTTVFVERSRQIGTEVGQWTYRHVMMDIRTRKVLSERPLDDPDNLPGYTAVSSSRSTVVVLNRNPRAERRVMGLDVAVWKPASGPGSYAIYEDWLEEKLPGGRGSKFEPRGFGPPAVSDDGAKVAYFAVRHWSTAEPDSGGSQTVVVLLDLETGQFTWAPTPFAAPEEAFTMDWTMQFGPDGESLLVKLHRDFNDVRIETDPATGVGGYLKNPVLHLFRWEPPSREMTKIGLLPEGTMALSTGGDAVVMERDETVVPQESRYWRSRAVLLVPAADIGRVGGASQRSQAALLGLARPIQVLAPDSPRADWQILKVFAGRKAIFAVISHFLGGRDEKLLVELNASVPAPK